MLVLSRKKNQTVVIDGEIEIQVLQIKGNTIRLGVNAPRDVRVLRGELKPFGLATDPDSQVSEAGAGYQLEIQSLTAQAS